MVMMRPNSIRYLYRFGHRHFLSRFSTIKQEFVEKLKNGPNLREFVHETQQNQEIPQNESIYFSNENYRQNVIKQKDQKPHENVYFEVYGCQMNVSDTEVVYGILKKTDRFRRVEDEKEADVILIMTCSIREGAEQKIWSRLRQLSRLKAQNRDLKIGILGCMAERLKEKIVQSEKIVDVVCGPDGYRDLPNLLDKSNELGSYAMNVQLSLTETYSDISPIKLNHSTKTAFVSIQRGCDNMCSFCIVPFVRGRERSRPIQSILNEIQLLSNQGIKDVTLLGQNVNSYCDSSERMSFNSLVGDNPITKGFKNNYKTKRDGLRFVDLLDAVSKINPDMRIRFTSPHPKEFPDELLYLIKERKNICNQLHLPAQSGSTTCLERMRRGYSREAYMQLVDKVRDIFGDTIALSSDFIAGFCGETEEEHQDTLSLIKYVRYNFCFTFPYSMREKTRAFHRFKDDVPHDVKQRRHMELTQTFRDEASKLNASKIGQIHLVLVEGVSKRSSEQLAGRNDNNTMVIFDKCKIPNNVNDGIRLREPQPGDYVACQIIASSSQTLRAKPLYFSTITQF